MADYLSVTLHILHKICTPGYCQVLQASSQFACRDCRLRLHHIRSKNCCGDLSFRTEVEDRSLVGRVLENKGGQDFFRENIMKASVHRYGSWHYLYYHQLS